MDACGGALELLGLLVYMGGWLSALATTIMPQWLTMSTEMLAIESYEQGLWETCVVQEVGGMECRTHDSLLGLPYEFKLGRVCMCTSLALGLLGILVAIPGLYLVNCCKGRGADRTKRTLIIIAGVLAMVAGVLCMTPVSYVAHVTVEKFFDETVPEVVPRWEFGDALFCGWAGGFLLVVAGVLLVSPCLCSQEEDAERTLQRRYHVRNTDAPAGKRTEYV